MTTAGGPPQDKVAQAPRDDAAPDRRDACPSAGVETNAPPVPGARQGDARQRDTGQPFPLPDPHRADDIALEPQRDAGSSVPEPHDSGKLTSPDVQETGRVTPHDPRQTGGLTPPDRHEAFPTEHPGAASPLKPPKPPAAEGRGTVLGYARRFRRDLLSALPARLYRAWMADFRSPLIRSVVCNDPALVRLVLTERPKDFPKSNRLREGLAPLLGQSVFVSNGAQWERQRRIIDPAFEGGRLRETFPAIRDAAVAAAARIAARADQGVAMAAAVAQGLADDARGDSACTDGATGTAPTQPGHGGAMLRHDAPGRVVEIDIEPETSHAAADAIFRTLFSLPIEHETAAQVFAAFRAHQDAQPIVNLAALIPLPAWVPRWHGRRTRTTARHIRGLIERMVAARAEAIAAGTAPDDLATKIMTTPDPQTGRGFTSAEMVDQVAIFFLAGHETSASALAWALWLLAADPVWQDRVAAEARAELTGEIAFPAVSRLRTARAVFREAMRLYPPVPMMVRETARPEHFRDRDLPRGTQVVISPWHLHRHERLWDDPDGFDPARWDSENGRACARAAYIPFSAGQRVCPGAGFAMIEGPLMLALICRDLRLAPGAKTPVPVARLTVRGQHGITLRIARRNTRREEQDQQNHGRKDHAGKSGSDPSISG